MDTLPVRKHVALWKVEVVGISEKYCNSDRSKGLALSVV